MNVHYEVKLEDIVQYYLHMSNTSSQFSHVVKRRQVRLFMVLALLGIGGLFVWTPSKWPIYGVIWAILSFFASISYPFFMYRRIGRRLRKFHAKGNDQGVYGKKNVTFNRNGITEQVDDMAGITYQWSSIHKVYLTSFYAFIHVSERQAIMIPRRIFENKEAWEECLSNLKAYQAMEVDDK